jgi:hypothetical protein
MSEKLQTFIDAILNESLGFSFGEPWRHDENSITCVLPIIRTSDEKQRYATLAEATRVKIQDTGNINRALVLNDEAIPVFLRIGELLEGDTQNRALVMSRVIMPKHMAEVEVKCVHASRGIRGGSLLRSSGYSPGKDSYYATSLHETGEILQSHSWNADRTYSRNVRGSLGNLRGRIRTDRLNDTFHLFDSGRVSPDDLTRTRDEYNKAVDEILQKVPFVDYEVGMALIDLKGLYFLDCFDHHKSWKAVKEAIIGKESLSITERLRIDKGGIFEYKPERAEDATKEVLKKEHKQKTQHQTNRTKTFTMDFGEYIGEAVELEDEIIHLLIIRREERALH